MGKSWCINHLAKMAVRFGYSPLVVPTEMSNNSARLRFKMSFTGLTASEVFKAPAEVREQTASSMNKGADIYLLSEDEKSMRVDELPAIIEDTESKTGKKIDLVLFDSADDLLPPEGRYKNSIESNTAIHTYLKNFAKDEDICVVTTAQVRREGEKKEWLGVSNVADNINKLRKATVGISINGVEREKKRHYYRIWLFKNTDGWEGAKVWCKRNFERGQFITRYGKFHPIAYKEMLDGEPILDKKGE
jgi:replicative DNA helicase